MENLVFVVLGLIDSPIIAEVFRLVTHCGCHIRDAQVNTTATHVTMTVFISGAWNTIAKFEGHIKKYDSQVLFARTQPRDINTSIFPYISHIIAPNLPDVLLKITEFLSDQEINLYNLQVESYKAPITEAAMLNITVAFGCSTNNLVADFREHFIVFCDENNFDVAMEPHKN